MRRIGNIKEVEKWKDADQELISSLEKCVGDGSFKQWKTEVTTVQQLELLYSLFTLND